MVQKQKLVGSRLFDSALHGTLKAEWRFFLKQKPLCGMSERESKRRYRASAGVLMLGASAGTAKGSGLM